MQKPTRVAVVDVCIKERSGVYYVSSPDIPGLHLCGSDRKALLADAPAAIELLYKLNNNLDVRITWASDPVRFETIPTRKVEQRRRLVACPAVSQLAAA